MSKSAVVLGVPHPLQGPEFRGCSGLGPSIAEGHADSLLGKGHYLDIDPPPSDRDKHAVAKVTSGWVPIDSWQTSVHADGYEWSIVDEQRKREELWLQRVQSQPFKKGLVICGTSHGLSFAFRLLSAGIGVDQAYSYLPHHKLCSRPHAS
jgi:hypothetical protein